MKITTWNAEWLDSDWGVVSGRYTPEQSLFPNPAPSRARATARIEAVRGYLRALAPDILFLCEGPKGEDSMLEFTRAVMPDHVLVTRPEGESYETGGRQWQWFLVRKCLADQIAPGLVPISIWRSFAALQDASISDDGTWQVAAPRLRDLGGVEDVPVSERITHRFYREPQVLRFTFGGGPHEIIGAHLKSKFTGHSPRKRRANETFDDYLAGSKTARRYIAKSHEARIKLSSEALAVRAYIERRFAQDADPSILVVGDLNDGPGKELMEREYLLHDLVSNLQGDVFFASKFLNHALFDQPTELRWTATFDDILDPTRNPNILLDHILFTQALTRAGSSPLWVQSGAGRVEHFAHEAAESTYGAGMISDHRPVSVELTPRASG